MSQMQSEVFGPSASSTSEGKALKAATSLGRRGDDVASIKGELLVIKWMMGFVLAFRVVIFSRLFTH